MKLTGPTCFEAGNGPAQMAHQTFGGISMLDPQPACQHQGPPSGTVTNYVVQQPEAPPLPPPPYAALPGLQVPPQPPAAIEEIDPDFVPKRSAAPIPPPTTREPEPETILSPPQKRILDMVPSGKSVLIHRRGGRVGLDSSHQQSF